MWVLGIELRSLDLLGKPLIFSSSFVDPTTFVSQMALTKSAGPMVMSVSLFLSHLGFDLAWVSRHCVLMANTLGVRNTLVLKGKRFSVDVRQVASWGEIQKWGPRIQTQQKGQRFRVFLDLSPGHQGGSVGRSAWHQALQLEFDPWNAYGERREPTSRACSDLCKCTVAHSYLPHTKQIKVMEKI